MTALPRVEDPMPLDAFVEASHLYRQAKKRGVTIRSSVDALIAVCGIRNDLEVLHVDRDFEMLATVSDLRQRRVA